jgi:hypothetical protein
MAPSVVACFRAHVPQLLPQLGHRAGELRHRLARLVNALVQLALQKHCVREVALRVVRHERLPHLPRRGHPAHFGGIVVLASLESPEEGVRACQMLFVGFGPLRGTLLCPSPRLPSAR